MNFLMCLGLEFASVLQVNGILNNQELDLVVLCYI
jgi:hypothetical protein